MTRSRSSSLRALWLLLFVPLGLAALLLLALYVHPVTGTAVQTAETSRQTDLGRRVEQSLAGFASDALEGLVPVKKFYTIEENAATAPAPNPALFGETEDPAEVQAVVERASALLEGQELVWNPDIERMPGTKICYYCDDTILVICWKESIEHGAANFAEVKIADGSQLRRMIAGGSYGSSVQLYASDMAKTANAVVAINGDFYTYRRLGITAWQRKVYRAVPNKVESAFFTSSGDMLFSHAGELASTEEAQRFVDENDVVFAVAFGPILVEDGELRQVYSYPIGEVDAQYSRSVIAQKDTLHYLLLTMGQEGASTHRVSTNKLAEIIHERGVKNAYTLDGGQTATLVFRDAPFNRVDWDTQRAMSDIIYFATAIPEEEWQS